MQSGNEYLATTPFDLYELSLFHLVVKHRSFTRAAELAGLTQSAITRQMQGMEQSLGLDLLERTTRTVRVTAAGQQLYRASRRILGEVEATLRQLREEHAGARPEVRLGVSRGMSLAYLPGFLHANLRRQPEVRCQVFARSSQEILDGVLAHDLDLGILCPPPRLPKGLQVTHRFEDEFTLLLSGQGSAPPPASGRRALERWAAAQSWLLLAEGTQTGSQLRRWMRRRGWAVEPVMELDSFDWIINLVALGLGVSLVPIRALALYPQKKALRRVALKERFCRELVVVARWRKTMPAHLARFVENILF